MLKFLPISFFICFNLAVQAQTIKINEIQTSNTKIADEDGDTPDWIELYNAGNENVNLLGYSITDDTNNISRWVFPDIWLSPQSTLLLMASGKDRKITSFYNTLINRGDEWYYAPGSAQIPTDWYNCQFDYTGWQKGNSGFGYGDNDDSTVVETGIVSVFTINEFNITDITKITELILHVDYDDGFVAYINGVEVARAGIGTAGTPVAYNAFATTSTEPQMTQGLAPFKYNIGNINNILKNDKNTIAVQVHNCSTTSSDLTLITYLTAGFESSGSNFFTPYELNLKSSFLHTNFSISSDGEPIILSDASQKIIDKVDSIQLPVNISYGRKPDGSGNMFYFNQPTPNTLNTTTGYSGFAQNDLTFLPAPGIFNSAVNVTITSASGNNIYYTTDGSDPNEQSAKYSGSIAISKGTVIKAVSFPSGLLPATPDVKSYLIINRQIDMPVMSLSTDPYNLWSKEYGICYDTTSSSTSDDGTVNYYKDWERPIYFEYFDETGKNLINSPAGVKMFGAYSRANKQKSMAIHARKEYGASKFKYSFFKTKNLDSFKSFILRNSGNDWNVSGLRDILHTTLSEGTGLDIQAAQPVVVFLNGKYWGILNIREKINEDYLENNHGVDADSVDILEGNASVNEGSAEHYQQLLSIINNSNMKLETTYNNVKNMMDVVNFAEYQIANIYVNNTDWPGNNIKYWREQSPNGRWRWLMFDTDFGFGIWDNNDFNDNTLEFALATNSSSYANAPWATLLLRKLLENPDFKADFINRFADRINYQFETNRVNYTVDSLADIIRNEIPYHIGRWEHMWSWEDKISGMKEWGKNRPDKVRGHISSQFGLGGTYKLTVDVNNSQMGYIQVNTLELTNLPWTGTYFKNNPITVTAVAKPGYRFIQWQNTSITESQINIAFTTTTQLIAVFEPYDTKHGAIVINEINYKSDKSFDTGDWLELYNTTNTTIDVSGYIVTDNNVDNKFIIANGVTIEPKGYLVVCQNINNFKSLVTDNINATGSLSFGFGSDFEVIKLYSRNGIIIDSVYYESSEPWPALPNGNGNTLSLIDPYNDNNNHYRWEASAKAGGTPGRQNDNFNGTNIEQLAITNQIQVNAYPNPVSQNTVFTFEVNQMQQVKIDIIDIKGTVIASVYEGNLQPGFNQIQWNTKNGSSAVKPGIYFASIKTANMQNKVIKLVVID